MITGYSSVSCTTPSIYILNKTVSKSKMSWYLLKACNNNHKFVNVGTLSKVHFLCFSLVNVSVYFEGSRKSGLPVDGLTRAQWPGVWCSARRDLLSASPLRSETRDRRTGSVHRQEDRPRTDYQPADGFASRRGTENAGPAARAGRRF